MIDKNTLHTIAQKSKLKVDANEEDIYLDALNRIISFIDPLKNINTEKVHGFDFVNHFNVKLRDDRSEPFKFVDMIFKNAPEFKNNYVVVKKERK
ncbi:MAG TPA: aspartyl/glutamyl-tRNA amidotransferase subunit C [Bacteroidales bacterium]|nr:aspartyl/glutamyl-tRNA amidotransferase subunit C [Bacteroidales bacterium]